jgi:citrate synthase
MDALGEDNYKPHPTFVKALDKLFILHADHATNCSTASVLQVGSSLVDPYQAIASGCAALYGPLQYVQTLPHYLYLRSAAAEPTKPS